ncbi:MAG: hypothetical protein A3I05_08385 [Deltaproteobacteria bacterium RIFCSPLOWO2_02_FULL_44_10]|nr:MAG: hypothetical protein A3C46_05430 [Deltaproteobacteria bacterium RIFCSPHIGHO2_02_FULL_44_16]OGQ45504.1 MAG: hypothetical protein A3I05_08385 [Deltaproteobacteria bacterium RIFCSPLOWO2_02_FULL_44_10]
MNWIHFFSLFSPWLVILAVAFLVLFLGSFLRQSRSLLSLLSCVGVVIAFFLSWQLWLAGGSEVLGMLFFDRLSFLGWMICLFAVALTILISPDYVHQRAMAQPEYYALLLFSTIGMGVFVAASDLLTLFLGLEIMSIALYPLTGFYRARPEGNEAALKYFLTGAFASAFLLMGIAFLFGSSGTTDLTLMSETFRKATIETAQLFGFALVLIGFAFKIAAVPFHAWAPDAYEGAPTPITNFMATAVKAAAFLAFLRIALTLFGNQGYFLSQGGEGSNIIAALAVATMLFGNLGAIMQDNVKRMLAYSSIAHAGYILVGFPALASFPHNAHTIVFYLLSYVTMTAGAFAILIVAQGNRESTDVTHFAGFGKRRPVLAALLTLFLISLTGFPPTIGFFAKYSLFYGAIKAGSVWLVVIALLNSVLSAYYYLRPVVVMYFHHAPQSLSGGQSDREQFETLPSGLVAVVTVTALIVILFGIFPAELLAIVEKSF